MRIRRLPVAMVWMAALGACFGAPELRIAVMVASELNFHKGSSIP